MISSKLKAFISCKTLLKRWKERLPTERKYLHTTYLRKGLISRIYKEHPAIDKEKKKNTPKQSNLKWAWAYPQNIPTNIYWRGYAYDKCMKTCSTSLVFRKQKLRAGWDITTYLLNSRIIKNNNTNVGKDAENLDFSYIVGDIYTIIQFTLDKSLAIAYKKKSCAYPTTEHFVLYSWAFILEK